MRRRHALILSTLVALGVISAWKAWSEWVDDEAQWRTFAAEHACKPVAIMFGDRSVPASTPNGRVVVPPGRDIDKVGHLCDDGVTYWR